MSKRIPKTPEQRKAERDALAARIDAATAALRNRNAFARFEQVVRHLPRRWTLNNALLLWAQAEEKGIALSDVRDFGGWLAVGRVPVGKGTGLTIFKPRRAAMSDKEIVDAVTSGEKFTAGQRPSKYAGSFPTKVWDYSQTQMSVDEDAAEKFAAYVAPRIPDGQADALIREAHAVLTTADLEEIITSPEFEEIVSMPTTANPEPAPSAKRTTRKRPDPKPAVVTPATPIIKVKSQRVPPELPPGPKGQQAQALAFLRANGYPAKVYKGWDAASRAWANDMRELAYAKAEHDCRGKLLSKYGIACEQGKAKNVVAPFHARDLWKGDHRMISTRASDELIAWFAEHGRPSGDEYAQMLLSGKGAQYAAGLTLMATTG